MPFDGTPTPHRFGLPATPVPASPPPAPPARPSVFLLALAVIAGLLLLLVSASE